MHLTLLVQRMLASLVLLSLAAANPVAKIKPKVVLINMFTPEAAIWYGIPEFNLLEVNITVPGLSPLFPKVHCTSNHDVCQVIAGESGANKCRHHPDGLYFSPLFDLTSSYFLLGGIAGINPKVATIGSVTFARYEVQVALQYEIDAREKPAKFETGYFPLGSSSPTEYPKDIYGTEVFEVSHALRDIAVEFAKTAKLSDSDVAKAYRAKYASSPAYKAASQPPKVVACDGATSDVFYTGKLLSEAFEQTTKLFTNGTGVYCTTAQEDSAILEVLLRGGVLKVIDFSRVIVMRSAANFDRPADGGDAYTTLKANSGGFLPSVENIYRAGVKVVEGILKEWDSKFCKDIQHTNYIGDIFGSLGGKPDFGPSEGFGSSTPLKRRVLEG